MPTIVAAFIFAPLAVIAASLLVIAWRGERRFMSRAHRAEGVVTGFVKQKPGRYSGSNLPILFPVIRFTTDRGATFSVKSRTGTSRSPYSVGQTVPILYDPNNPKDMRTDDFTSRWIGVMLAGGLLLVVLFFGSLAVLGPIWCAGPHCHLR